MSAHAVISASAAERDTICPISVTGKGSDITSRAAAEGTMGHGIAEDVLRGLPWPAIGEKRTVEGHEFEVTQAFLEDVYVYVKLVQGINWTTSGYNVEAKVNYSRSLGVPYNYAFGTSDCWGFSRDAQGLILEVIDLKMGRKAVNPERNPQAARYAAGVLDALYPAMLLPRDFRVRVTISQPRLSHRPFQWMTTVGTIEDMMRDMRPAAAAAVAYYTGTATQETWNQFPEIAGKHCHYCRRKGECNAFQRTLREVADKREVNWSEDVYRMAPAIKAYLEDMEQLALDKALAGTPLPGTKLVEGKSPGPVLLMGNEQVRQVARSIGVENQVVKVEEVWATPAKVRDAFVRAGMQAPDLAKVVAQKPASPKIALADDPRPALRNDADLSAFKVG